MAQWWRNCLSIQETWFHPWPEKIPHAKEQLSPCAPTTDHVPQSPEAEPTGHNYWSPAPRAHAPQEKLRQEIEELQVWFTTGLVHNSWGSNKWASDWILKSSLMFAFPEIRDRWAPVKAFTISLLFALQNGSNNRNRVNNQSLPPVKTLR